jgi:hypothetical protein
VAEDGSDVAAVHGDERILDDLVAAQETPCRNSAGRLFAAHWPFAILEKDIATETTTLNGSRRQRLTFGGENQEPRQLQQSHS